MGLGISWPPVSMRARSRSVLLFGRLPPGLLMSCRDARRPAAARHWVVNPAGPSTIWWQLSADHHLSRTAKQRDELPGACASVCPTVAGVGTAISVMLVSVCLCYGGGQKNQVRFFISFSSDRASTRSAVSRPSEKEL